jgi:hypothetical protein
MKRAFFGVLAVVGGLSGCASPAHVIQKDDNFVVVAIPENSDSWPTHYRPAADELAKNKIGPCKAVNEGEVVTGGRNSAGPTASASPSSKEYRITYQKMPQAVPVVQPVPVVGRPPMAGGPAMVMTPMPPPGMQPAGFGPVAPAGYPAPPPGAIVPSMGPPVVGPPTPYNYSVPPSTLPPR